MKAKKSTKKTISLNEKQIIRLRTCMSLIESGIANAQAALRSAEGYWRVADDIVHNQTNEK